MHGSQRTPAYWPTRIMLAIGFFGTAAVLLAAPVVVTESESCFGCDSSNVLGLPVFGLEVAVAVAPAVIGLIWMIRIFRGPRDRPPRWRYRDR